MGQQNFSERRPRHQAILDSGCRVTLNGIAGAGPLAAELEDVSRKGLRLVLDSPLPADARICLSFDQPENRFTLALPVLVRWSRQQDDGRWGAGCVFTQELSWETMGELFLNGILCVEEIPGDPLLDNV